ncbi:MAG: hypothetical protein ACAH83_14230 [Alphaproteobacteria bacterium]
MTSPKETIEKARTAFTDGNYADALELYDHFYEHALEADPSYYGVRLSYCLDEWAELAKKYQPAKVRLEEKMATALRLLDTTRNPERFHDYHAICHFLKCPDKSIEKFFGYHDSDPQLALSLFSFIRDDLVAAKQWNVCSTYLSHPEKQYSNFLEAFDGSMRLAHKQEQPDEFESFSKEWFVTNAGNLLLILKNAGRKQEAEAIYQQCSVDMQSRKFADLIAEIKAHARL